MNAKAIFRVSIAVAAITAGTACYDDPLAVDVPLEGDRALPESQSRRSAAAPRAMRW